jgi:hypothetical protein
MEVLMPIEWGIIFTGTVFMAAYFSYRAGHRAGMDDGIDSTLTSLEAQGIIELEREPEDF